MLWCLMGLAGSHSRSDIFPISLVCMPASCSHSFSVLRISQKRIQSFPWDMNSWTANMSIPSSDLQFVRTITNMPTEWQTGMTKLPVNSSCNDSHFWSCQGKASCLTCPRSIPRKVKFCTPLRESKIYHTFIWCNTWTYKISVWMS